MKGGGAAALALWLSAAVPAAAVDGFAPLALEIHPIETFQPDSTATRFGALDYRGGLSIRADADDFGGLSGLDVRDDGTLVAVSDGGQVFTARMKERDGRLVGLADAGLAPLLDLRGRPSRVKQEADAEGMRLVSGPDGPAALVVFEFGNGVRRYEGTTAPVGMVPIELDLPEEVANLRTNQGLEAIAIPPRGGRLDGAMVLIAERTLDQDGNLRGWIVGGPQPGAFAIARDGGYDVTDADFLADGSLLVLERRFGLAAGLAMRIRHIAAEDLAPGRLAHPVTLMEAGWGFEIDNMEGLAVLGENAGTVELLVLSDDNRSLLQRTLLLKFAWTRGAPD